MHRYRLTPNSAYMPCESEMETEIGKEENSAPGILPRYFQNTSDKRNRLLLMESTSNPPSIHPQSTSITSLTSIASIPLQSSRPSTKTSHPGSPIVSREIVDTVLPPKGLSAVYSRPRHPPCPLAVPFSTALSLNTTRLPLTKRTTPILAPLQRTSPSTRLSLLPQPFSFTSPWC